MVHVWQLPLHLIPNYSMGSYHQGNLPRTSKTEGSPIVFHVNSFIRRSHSEGKGKEESPVEENDIDGE